KVIFPEIRSIEQHFKDLRFIRFQTKIEVCSVISDIDIICFVFDKTTEICKSSIDNLKTRWHNLSKRYILYFLICRIANRYLSHQLASLSDLAYIQNFSVSTLI